MLRLSSKPRDAKALVDASMPRRCNRGALMKVLSALLLCALAACNSSAPPLPPPAASTIPNLTVFLVQGTPEQKFADQVTYRKHDYPPPNGYQVDDSVFLPDGRILQTFSYPPF